MSSSVGHSVVIRHGFEAAHRLPQLGGACASVHGHSWQAEVTVSAASMTAESTVVEFGAFKRMLRSWIDAQFDNGAMLGAADSLLPAFMAAGSKTFRFGVTDDARTPEELASDMPWPTVEAVAVVIARAAGEALAGIPRAEGSRISQVLVAETRVNSMPE